MDAASGTVLLRTAHSVYVLRVDRPTGSVRHVHWGAPLPLTDAVVLPLWAEHDNSFAGRWDGVEEFPVDGGARFGVPALEVRFADGSSPLEPTVEDIVLLRDDHVVIHLRDRSRPLSWQLHYQVPAGGDVLERWTEFEHTGTDADGDIMLLRYASAHWPLPQRPGWRIGSVHGGWSAEGRLERSGLPVGETTLGSRRGHTGHHANPWATLDAGDADEEHGEVWTVALAASGSWRLTAQRTPAGRTGVVAGRGTRAPSCGSLRATATAQRSPSPCTPRTASVVRAGPSTATCVSTSCRVRGSCGRCSTTPGRPPPSR
ncbi:MULTISPECIES: glycoside hydrolase family 36 N-terminal domain-containing protein [unclassified Streptomyces]|uniref:glycoside hydrolase family 36 N-terminal domain-containing protein n=1 Tax=unclassified Streptomyces TaxID=2593676 RepID=UPI0035D8EFF6